MSTRTIWVSRGTISFFAVALILSPRTELTAQPPTAAFGEVVPRDCAKCTTAVCNTSPTPSRKMAIGPAAEARSGRALLAWACWSSSRVEKTPTSGPIAIM